MGNITNPRLIFAKGVLFLVLGMISAVMLLLEAPNLRVAALLAVAVWAFCRFYYFAFYVIEHYVDSSYRFAGLWSFVKYAVRRTK
jgi:hypothetical protein